jgi:hypothetical protein
VIDPRRACHAGGQNDFRDIDLRNWLVICCVVTEDSPSRMRGYGPFPEGAEPTQPIPAQPTDAEQRAQAAPASSGSGGPGQEASGHPAAGHGEAANPGGPVSPQNANVPPSAQNGETAPIPASPADAPDEPAEAGPGYGALQGQPGYGPDPEATTPYPPQPTTPYPIAPTGMNPHLADPSGMDPAGGAPAITPTSASGIPYAPAPTSGTHSYGPFQSDNYDFASPGRRIEPSPPPDRSGLLVGLLAGLIAGLLVFGAGGFFAGRATAPDAQAKPGPSPAGKLGVFEQSQVALNQPHFAGTGLVTISRGWLPYLSSCSRSGEPGGPALHAGEKTRVRCTLDGMSAFFVEYAAIADRDKARVNTLRQNVDARTLTPGAGAAVQRPAPSGRTNGNYVEYAYRLTEGGVTRPVAAIWWDDAHTPVAGYLLAYWKEGLGESWDPMRDLWARYA